MTFAFSCTKSWYKYLVVDLYSLLKTNPKVKKIYLFLETEKKEEIENLLFLEKKYNVEFVLVNFNNFKNNYVKDANPNLDTPYTDFAFAKLLLADYVKEDKIIYLDTDTIVKKDISRLWEIDIDDYYAAGCKDLGVINQKSYFPKLDIKGKYINSGVMLLNLKKIREDNLIPKFFEILNSRELLYPDQDALNLVCTEKLLYIPSIYNYKIIVTREIISTNLVKIWHFAGPKEQWIVDIYGCEEWYEVEEEFFYLLKQYN